MFGVTKTSNPALSQKIFNTGFSRTGTSTMTLNGAVTKTAILLLLVIVPASFVWKIAFTSMDPGAASPWMMGGLIGGLIAAMITIFKKEWSAITAPIYAILEGLFLGGISAYFEASYPGLVMRAVTLTFTTFFAMLFFYRSGMIKVTNKFRSILFAATGGIALIYLLSWILGMFGIGIPLIHDNGMFGIIFSLVVVGVAAFNLILDFDFIEQGAQAGVPKYMEWYSAFGLMVTLIWLYVEILRLLSKIASRD